MKKIKSLALGILLVSLAGSVVAQDKKKEKTISGEAKCAKCAMHETDKCQTAIETQNADGKKVTYYLANNDVAKNFHDEICKEDKKVKATGTVKKVDGKMELTATKIEETK
jgi:hypothetical protein